MDSMDKQKFIFGSLFVLNNNLQTVGDQYFKVDDITTRQWFLTIIIDQFGDYSPTLSEVAELMGSSHQNVKQLALKLEEKEFVKIQKDEKDARVLRLSLTHKCETFWEKRQEQDNQFIRDLFQDITEVELGVLSISLNKLIDRIFTMKKQY